MGVEPAAAARAHELLDHHGHALLLEIVLGHLEIGARLGREQTGVDEAHRLAQLAQPDLGIGMGVGDDVGVVDAREGDHEHVLEEAGRADGEGPVGDGHEPPEPLGQGLAQGRLEEARAHGALALLA